MRGWREGSESDDDKGNSDAIKEKMTMRAIGIETLVTFDLASSARAPSLFISSTLARSLCSSNRDLSGSLGDESG